MIAIYARQSIEKKDSLSIETQIKFCRNHINTKPNKEEIKIYQDSGYSGKNTNRPDFEKLMSDIDNGLINKIVVYKLDRISRNLLDFMNMYKKFKLNKVEFCSVNDTFDTTTPMGRGMLKIAMVFAEMERETIQMRVKDNYYERIKDGRWAGGPAPFGFKKGRIGNIPTLEIEPKEMEAVRLIFDWYEEDLNISLGKIARRLAEKGIEGRKRKSFDNVAIARILKNPVYCKADKILYKYYENQHMTILNPIEEWNGKKSAIIVGKKIECEEIENKGKSNEEIKITRKYTDPSEQTIYLSNFGGVISSRTFIKVQERLATNKQITRGNAPSRMKELAGLVKCAKCGYAIKIYNDPTLDCYGNRGLHLCNCKFQTHIDTIREYVQKEILKRFKEFEKINRDRKTQYERTQGKIIKLQSELSNLISHAAKSPLLTQATQKEIEAKQQEINELEIKMHIQQLNRINQADIEVLEYDSLSIEAKKDVCRKLIQKILLHENGDISIYWKI